MTKKATKAPKLKEDTANVATNIALLRFIGNDACCGGGGGRAAVVSRGGGAAVVSRGGGALVTRCEKSVGDSRGVVQTFWKSARMMSGISSQAVAAAAPADCRCS